MLTTNVVLNTKVNSALLIIAMLYVMSIINTNPKKYQSENPTEWIYITKNLRCRFEFWSCLSEIKIMVVFEKNTHWSLNGFHFTKKWRFWKTDFNSEIQKYSNDFCG